MTCRKFTLLEILIALVLILIASSAIGIKMNGAIKKKRFHSNIDCFADRIVTAQKLALITQTDWSGYLEKQMDHWILFISSEEGKTKELKRLKMSYFDISLNGRIVKNRLDFEFLASGGMLPEGILSFTQGNLKRDFSLAVPKK